MPTYYGKSNQDDPADSNVRLMHWDARWRQEFEQTRSSLLQSCEGRVVDVIHVGATAVPGLIAQPIVDVVAVVADPVDLADSSLLIEGLNFRELDVPEWARTQSGQPIRLLQKPRHGEATHRVYVTTQGSAMTEHMVHFRDSLRSDSQAAMQWEETKVQCWNESDGDETRYTELMDKAYRDAI